MSLETVDIHEVMHGVAEGNLQLVTLADKNPSRLTSLVIKLEQVNGSLVRFLEEDMGQHSLFDIEKTLALPEHKDLKKRWEAAINLSNKIRMKLLRCRALDMLESYENKSSTSSAPDIAYCKAVLADVLAEGTEKVKAKYAYLRNPGAERTTDDEEDSVEFYTGE